MNSNWTHRTRPSPLVLPASGDANPKVHQDNIRVTTKAPPMPRVTLEQREAVAAGLVIGGRKRLCAAAHQASLAAARCTVSTTAIPMPPPTPPPPPTGPTTTRLIKAVSRRTSYRSSFSQLDGQDNSVDENDCSTTVADEENPLIATPASLQSPPPSTTTHQRGRGQSYGGGQ